MLTAARIEEDLRPRDLDWITSLRAPTIAKLWREGPLQLSLFDDQDLAEITAEEAFPGERLIACRNPLLARDRARKRRELLDVTEEKLQAVADATRRSKRPLRGQDKIGVRVGRVLARSKVGKHFTYEITEDGFHAPPSAGATSLCVESSRWKGPNARPAPLLGHGGAAFSTVGEGVKIWRRFL